MKYEATWRELITFSMSCNGESWNDVESCTLTKEELDEVFDIGFGGNEGKRFTLWTHNRVYFHEIHDGAAGVCSVPRHPDGKATSHIGGE